MAWGEIFFWPYKLGFSISVLIIKLVVLVFVLWMVIDAIQRKFKVEAERWIWIVLMVITTWAGAIVYYVAVRALNPKGIGKK